LLARCWWLTPVILATQEAEIRRIVWFKASPGKQFCETLDRKNPSQEGVDGMTQSIDFEFKYQYCKKKRLSLHFNGNSKLQSYHRL
jgi:hypothetical protein